MSEARKRSNIVPLNVDARAKNALKYDPRFCQLIIDLAKQGEFPEQWCAQIQISMATMYNWANRYEEFDNACRFAWTCLSAHWTGEAIRAAYDGSANTKLLILILQKRFPDTWGHCARNTSMHFFETIAAQTVAPAQSEPNYDGMSLAELEAELEILQKRSKYS